MKMNPLNRGVYDVFSKNSYLSVFIQSFLKGLIEAPLEAELDNHIAQARHYFYRLIVSSEKLTMN